MGMGLFLCQDLIDSYKGTMWIEGGLGKVSTFCFALACDKMFIFHLIRLNSSYQKAGQGHSNIKKTFLYIYKGSDIVNSIANQAVMKFNLDDLKTARFSKGDILLFKGDVARFAYKVVKGCLRSYVVDAGGKEHIIQFAPEDWLISDMNSFLNSVPAYLYIDAVEATEVLLFDRFVLQQMEALGKNELIRQMQALQRNSIAVHKRLALLLSSTSQERYLDFIATYPKLVNRIPLKFIASYIGVTPEYLSEIRRKIVKP